MSGIVFLGTGKMEAITDFYVNRIGMQVWLRQADCIILRHGNLLLGFCRREEADVDGIYTFFYRRREDVQYMYERLEEEATTMPEEVERYGIFRFFALDPEGRKVEFQHFLHPVGPHMTAGEVLETRRSVREFEAGSVPDDLVEDVVRSCRWAPSSRNAQPCYYVEIRDRETLEFLADRRGGSSAPIARAPMAVAICSDPGISTRHVQDGCIAAYHLLLSAWYHGLGTCWIAAMDREDVKERLEVPRDHYVATVTPLGFPASMPGAPERRDLDDLLRRA